MTVLLNFCPVNLAVFQMFDLFFFVPSTIFQLNRDGSSWVEPALSYDKCVLLKNHNAVTPVRLEPAALRSRFKHSTTEPIHFHIPNVSMYFHSEWKTVWILIRWLHQKPSDQNLQCFQKRINLCSAGEGLNYFCLVLLCFHAHLFVDALWSPVGKGLTSWLSFVMCNCDITFSLVSWVLY